MSNTPPRPLTEAEQAEGFRWELIEDQWEMIRNFRPGDEGHPLLKELDDKG
jgi:hypothetical protein